MLIYLRAFAFYMSLGTGFTSFNIFASCPEFGRLQRSKHPTADQSHAKDTPNSRASFQAKSVRNLDDAVQGPLRI